MAFINFPSPTPIFPVLRPLAWSVHKQPENYSENHTAVSGREIMLIRAVFPRWEFTLTYGGDSWLRDQTQNITPETPIGFTEFEQLSGLYLQCLGPYGEFYYSDPDDDSRTNEFQGQGNGTQTTWPLYYTWLNGPLAQPMVMPVGGIASLDAVYLNGVLQSPSTYTVDSTNTAIVFTTAPGSGVAINASFHFYYRCRFSDDSQNYSQWAKNLWEVKEVKFISVKQ